uniref:Uncharacterized protein n=1 Tax=Brassica oleracea var. oleracea TaxID=109376 RepID=A0A0D3DKW7_BRAOL
MSVPTRHDFTEPPREESVPIYGPPRYYFKPHDGVLPPGALRDAHDHISRVQRCNKAQDRTIEKLKDKCKALSKTVKKQAKTSAKFMKKVADVLTRGGIAGCSSADFAFANTSVPQPPPQPTDLGFPLSDRQLQRQWRNPPTQPSTSGNKSPSLASSEIVFLLAMSSHLQTSLPMSSRKFTCGQVLEYHMEFLETLGCIWSSKEVIKVIIGRAVHGRDFTGATRPGATQRGRSRLHHPERRDQSDTARSIASPSPGATRPGATQRGRSRLHHPERRDQSDTARSIASPSPGATRPGATQRGRSRLHHPERRDRSDTARPLASPSPRAT